MQLVNKNDLLPGQIVFIARNDEPVVIDTYEGNFKHPKEVWCHFLGSINNEVLFSLSELKQKNNKIMVLTKITPLECDC